MAIHDAFKEVEKQMAAKAKVRLSKPINEAQYPTNSTTKSEKTMKST